MLGKSWAAEELVNSEGLSSMDWVSEFRYTCRLKNCQKKTSGVQEQYWLLCRAYWRLQQPFTNRSVDGLVCQDLGLCRTPHPLCNSDRSPCTAVSLTDRQPSALHACAEASVATEPADTWKPLASTSTGHNKRHSPHGTLRNGHSSKFLSRKWVWTS
jgi:hypothetical protein